MRVIGEQRQALLRRRRVPHFTSSSLASFSQPDVLASHLIEGNCLIAASKTQSKNVCVGYYYSSQLGTRQLRLARTVVSGYRILEE